MLYSSYEDEGQYARCPPEQPIAHGGFVTVGTHGIGSLVCVDLQ